MRLLEALAYSSLWVAAAAAALAAAASRAMGSACDLRAVALAFSGTLVVYNVDRLRDLQRDQATAPRRSAFVERNGRALTGLTALAGLLAGGLVLSCGPGVVALLAPIAAAGLFHRRLKRFGGAKPIYVSAAWIAVVAGVPALLADRTDHLHRVAAILGLAILANAIASNVRDREARLGPERSLRVARLLALAGGGLCIVAPLRDLVPVPALMFLALLPFRADERYGLIVVDGALLLGGLLAFLALR